MRVFQSVETAPKDKAILLDIGYPWLVVGMWNEYHEEFVYSEPQCCETPNGIDTWFENEYVKPGKVLGWIPVPDKQNLDLDLKKDCK